MSAPCVVGVDFGTLSGRAVVVRVADGAELGQAVRAYASGAIEHELPASGERLPAQWALQDPADWIAVLGHAVPAAVAAAGVTPADVIGIGIDCTASTPMPVLADGTPLCRLDGWQTRPHAYPKLWKHHAAQPQADRINALAEAREEFWLPRYGGRISSEWEVAKALQVLEEDPEAYAAMDRWIEGTDWIVWQLCGRETRNVCTAGYKGIHQDGRRPSRDFLAALDVRFADFVADKLEHPLAALGDRAGSLTAQAAAWTGLPTGIAVAVGNADAHVTAPAAHAIAPGQMLAVMGTSTCHVMNAEHLVEVPGMCGVVDGGITPGLWGYEAGQSGVGDIFGWLVDLTARTHDELSELAARQAVGEHGLVALDWHSGNRSVLVDHELSGLIVGLTLDTRPEDVYRALIEATAFGTRAILEAFEDAGLPVEELFVAGGLIRNPLVMQIYTDVTRRPLHVIESDQGPALGAALHAAVAAGAHADIRAASRAMGGARRDAYRPDASRADAYDDLTPAAMVVCDLDGTVVEGDLAPSSDAATHGYVYRQLHVGAVAHTHSPYATAWAVAGEEIPCVMTAMADEFGGPIPIGPFALIGDEAIGRGIVETLDGHPSPAVLMRSHGVFTVGEGPREAIKAAVMCEDAARTVFLARSLGDIRPLDPDDIDALHDRYQHVYGQR